jgi:hypothetical protein
VAHTQIVGHRIGHKIQGKGKKIAVEIEIRARK